MIAKPVTRILSILAVPAWLALATSQATAFRPLDSCWPEDFTTWDGDVAVRLLPISFPGGSIDRTDVLTALARWNDMRGMSFEFESIADDVDNRFETGNGVNEVAFADPSFLGGNLGLTRIRFNSCFLGRAIIEADVLFDVSQPWEMGAHNPREIETAPSFRFTAVHEFGHFLGLDHEPNQLSVMLTTASAFHGGSPGLRASVFPDDATGSRRMYSHANRETDFAITNFRLVSADNTALILGSGTQVIRRGGTFTAGFGFSNLGNTSVDTEFIFVLSTDTDITTDDRVVGVGRAFGPAGTFVSATFTLAAPADLAPGFYFMGAILDPSNRIAEEREGNNRVVFPGRVRIMP